MNYKLEDLLDIKKVQKLMDKFYNLTKIPYAVLDVKGNTILKVGQTKICANFHMVNEESLTNCSKVNKVTKIYNDEEDSYHEYVCKNGLIEACSPIVVNDEHIANLNFGQFLKREPDLAYFERQAEKFGFSKKDYFRSCERNSCYLRRKN